ncbi:lipase family protein [Peribacillus butanolivorans]|uniref:lipase family protein n=1 Tax=Peribacillus butanolivorans TaxID=421767 RepID=UPI003672826D
MASDLICRLLSQIVYFDLDISKYRNVELNLIPELKSRLEEELQGVNSILLKEKSHDGFNNKYRYEDFLSGWCFASSLKEIRETIKQLSLALDVFLDAYAFVNEGTKEVIIAFRGTNRNDKKQLFYDMAENIQCECQAVEKYIKKAINEEKIDISKIPADKQIFDQRDYSLAYLTHINMSYSKDIYSYILVGHSKGGSVVQRLIQRTYNEYGSTRYKGVTFSSPAVLQYDVYQFLNCKNFVIKNDIVILGSNLLNKFHCRKNLKYYVGSVASLKNKSIDRSGHKISCNYDKYFDKYGYIH